MSQSQSSSHYLVISRGKWDEDKSPEQIQQAIDAFYVWHDQLVREGKMISGQRLAKESMFVSKLGIIDGPFAETKEVIGGYWHFVAASLEEAAALAAQNPCMACGLSYEVRPVEMQRCSAFAESSETPSSRARR